jgi:AcrR family transcriptional regulator
MAEPKAGTRTAAAPEARWVDTSASRRATRHADHRASRRAAIVKAAAAAIEELGEAAGPADFAARAGVPRPHVYRHFGSTDDLTDEVARYAANALAERVRPSLSRSGTPPLVVRGIVAEAVAWADENPNLYRFMAARQQSWSLNRDRFGRHSILAEISRATTVYQRERAGNQVPDGVLAGLVGMVDASITWWLDHRDEHSDHVVDRLSRQVLLILADQARR